MVEVVGTAPTSAMFITKFVYRRSWKSNMNNIKLYFEDSINLLKVFNEKIFINQRVRDLKYHDKMKTIFLALEEKGELGILSK